MKEYIIYVETVNNTKYYYTNKKYNELNITSNVLKANKYKTFSIAKGVTNRQKLFNKYCDIKGFKSLNINLMTGETK